VQDLHPCRIAPVLLTGNGDPVAIDEKGVGDSGPYGAESEVEKSKRSSVLPRKRPRSYSVAIQVEVVVSEPTSDWVSVTAGTEDRVVKRLKQGEGCWVWSQESRKWVLCRYL
jgi:hypothetical protein